VRGLPAPLYEQIVLWILKEIREQRLRPGDRVMSERELAQRFGVSTMTSKGALARLAAQGIIVRFRGKGSFVAEVRSSLHELAVTVPPSSADASSEHSLEGLSDAARASVRDHVIALIVPGFADSFGVKIVRAVEEACARMGIHMLMRVTHGLRALEDQAIDDCLRVGVSGILVMPVHGENYNTKILRMVIDGFPVVLLDRYFKGIPTKAVHTDNLLAAQDLTELLMDYGHRHVAFLSPPNSTSSISSRLQGYRDAHSLRGYLAPSEHVYSAVYSTMPLYENDHRNDLIELETRNLEQFMARQPEITAYVACEYEIAVLMRRVLTKKGVRIPEDVSLVCFDNYRGVMDELFFTHVRQDEEAMGRVGVELVVQSMLGDTTPQIVHVPYNIIQSQSAGPAISISN